MPKPARRSTPTNTLSSGTSLIVIISLASLISAGKSSSCGKLDATDGTSLKKDGFASLIRLF
jgi:hypothetical protein